MSATVTPPPKPAVPVSYPDRDGKPMADNTIQFRWILMLYTHLAAQFRDDANVFVAGDNLIYSVEGDNKKRLGPDVYVTFGRPEVGRETLPQVVFDVLSPGWRFAEMQDKFAFYEKHGAEEYYILYPEFPMYAEAYLRGGTQLARIAEVNGYISPRTGLRFALETGQLTVFGRDGRPLRTAEELAAEREKLAAKLRELGVDPDTL